MHQRESRTRSRVRRTLAVSAGMATALVLPLATMEWRASHGFPSGVPVALFATLWLLAVACCVVAWSAARQPGPAVRDGTGMYRRWATLAVALVLAWLWISLVQDQWPCFRGVPNCD